jgi:hypothetical protein
LISPNIDKHFALPVVGIRSKALRPFLLEKGPLGLKSRRRLLSEKKIDRKEPGI